MPKSEYWFDLPEKQIAQQPLERREASRMLVVDRGSRSYRDSEFTAFPGLIRKGDVIVLNDTKVFPARLFGSTDTGANVEIFLVREVDTAAWHALAKPARRLRAGKTVNFEGGLSGEIVEKSEDGTVTIRFDPERDLTSELERIGRTPLPPYIKRSRDAIDADRERYQTVYAANRGSIAAPTAGLHFTPEMIGRLEDLGAEITKVTLHVGYGTFEPVRNDDLSQHRVMAEEVTVGADAAEKLNKAKAEGRRVVAIGTTTTRALEGNVAKHGRFTEERDFTDLTITPGHRFKAIDALLTNFHLPESSLLILVSTFAGRELIMEAYEHAVAAGYRFYSYGDCMFIV
ncbi:MAG TPA: tRNA preQ1(34) S-adenosylmethionine ribosyltransferase-isomerase QueA [Pyrinomonadaceae bacterium]|nr:tRNA preQ1(34) S-adenosylmethionine ribosyltransferase-isomerase QueA [Pyrinomonadaceae bacterium]